MDKRFIIWILVLSLVLINVNAVILTVDLNTTDSTYTFGQRYIKGNNNYETFGNVLTTSPTAMNSHTHSLNTYTGHLSGGYVGGELYTSSTTYIPKYLTTGVKELEESLIISIPDGVVLFETTSETHGYSSLSGYYLGIGYSSDGGSSTHSHTNPSTTNQIFKSTDPEALTFNIGTINSSSNEINNRQELYTIYNSDTYDNETDRIPKDTYLLQLTSYSVPSNYEEVDLSGKEGLLRFVDNVEDILNDGGSENHTHTISNRNFRAYSEYGFFSYYGTTGSSSHIPSYKSVRIIKRTDAPYIIFNSSINPSPIYFDTDAEGYCTPTGTENKTITFYYEWFKNNISISSGSIGTYNGTEINEISININNLSNTNFDPSDELIFNCYINDGSTDSLSLNSTEVRVMDYDAPTITFNTLNEDNSSEFLTNFNLNISVTDLNNYLTEINITQPNGTIFFSESYDTTGSSVYNINDQINMTENGYYTFRIDSADGHTKEKIKPIKNIIKDNKINFEDYNIIIYAKNLNFIPSTEYNNDRYTFDFKRTVTSNKKYDEFIVESRSRIDIIYDSKYKGHMVVQDGNIYNWYWIDFETDEGYDVELKKLDHNLVNVKVFGDNTKDYKFKSIGKLNVETIILQYYYNNDTLNLSEEYETNLISGFNTNYYLYTDINKVRYDITDGTAILEYNGNNYSSTRTSYNETDATYKTTIAISEEGIINHTWYYSIINISNETEIFTTDYQNQTIYETEIGVCNASLTNTISTLNFKDELNDSTITIDLGYDLIFSDGTYTYNVTGSGSLSTISFCTNIPTPEKNQTWNMYGSLYMEKTNYTTRNIQLEETNSIEVSNNDPTTQDFYLITTDDSNTIIYNWLSTTYNTITGIMEVYKCNLDGTEELIESNPISSGQSYANLKLYTNNYKYKVIYNDVLYEQDQFSICHAEPSTERTYFIDVFENSLNPVIGLFLIDCELERIDNDTVSMIWNDNSESDSEITGCIVGYRELNGQQELFQNCSTTNSIQSDITDDTEFVKGRITQDGNTAYCKNILSFSNGNNENYLDFGYYGLFLLGIIIMVMVLLFEGNGDLQIIGSLIGIFLGFLIGLTNSQWLLSILMIGFGGYLLWVGSTKR